MVLLPSEERRGERRGEEGRGGERSLSSRTAFFFQLVEQNGICGADFSPYGSQEDLRPEKGLKDETNFSRLSHRSMNGSSLLPLSILPHPHVPPPCCALGAPCVSARQQRVRERTGAELLLRREGRKTHGQGRKKGKREAGKEAAPRFLGVWWGCCWTPARASCAEGGPLPGEFHSSARIRGSGARG
ncbi:hypothetical protein AOLI_G00210970 [Acnodon oligacanthus]